MRHLVLVAVALPSVALAQNAPLAPAPTDATADAPTSDTPTSDAPTSDTPTSDTPTSDTPTSDRSKSDTSKTGKPKGRIIDPWARIPRPRGKLRLPDPRRAAEKATAHGTVAPAPPEPVTRTEPSPEPQVTATPAVAPAPAPPAATALPLPRPSTPFGTTTLSIVRRPPPAPHEGLTLEAGTGIGWIRLADRNNAVTSPGGVAGLSIGIGGWLDESVALTARIAGSSVPSSQGLVVATFLGPSLQLWIGERTWCGAGFGLSTFGIDAEGSKNDYALRGFAADLRLGHTFYANGKHTLNASLELTPGEVSEEREYGGEVSLTVMSIGLLFGWQYL